MVNSYAGGYFPSQLAKNSEKMSDEYGLQVGRAIQHEWFSNDNGTERYRSNQTSYHNLRLYARGEQSIQKYKDELSINGDLSYLNLDWKPVPVLSKFIDIVVNGISDRAFDIKTYAQDPFGVSKRTAYMNSIVKDMRTKEFKNQVMQDFGINLFENDPSKIPATEEELNLHMQLSYKQGIEIAEETAINTLLAGNDYENIKKRTYYDLATIGIGAVKTNFSKSEGATVKYVDPANLVYSYTESPYFEDIYYAGEVKTIPINELVKEFPNLTDDQLKKIKGTGKLYSGGTQESYSRRGGKDDNTVQVLYFNYKTYLKEVYKTKITASGADKVIERNDDYQPPASAEFGILERPVETLFDGAIIVGSDILLKWELCKNMLRPKSDYTKVKMNYSIVAPRMYKGRIESLVSRCTGFADMIQLTHLKLQQVMQKMMPDGVYLDADGLAEIDLGNGTNYNPQEALNMFFQTGSVIGRSFTQEGDMNPGKVPIQPIQTGAGGQKLQTLITTYNYYMQMIRDVTGLNEARDGSTPDSRALVGVQKLAAANSNTATRHILDSGLYLTKETAEKLSLRISDIIEYSDSREAFIQKIGGFNVATLADIKNLHIHDFGIFLELTPDDEEKARLENNIQTALSASLIDLDDAIDIREIKNIKTANQVLKIRKAKKFQRDQLAKQQAMQAQAQANAQQQQVAAQLEIQKTQANTQAKMQLEQMKAQLDASKMEAEVMAKRELMALEFDFNMKIKNMEAEVAKSNAKEKEDRKDERTKIQATQQSELIDQRKKETAPKNFESAGNDILGGGFGLGTFDPK
jgi:hypothetical protein